MKNFLLVLTIVMVFILGCNSSPEEIQQERKRQQDYITKRQLENKQNLNYIKDERTGFCFAITSTTNRDGAIGAIATVPCTEEVEKLLIKSEK